LERLGEASRETTGDCEVEQLLKDEGKLLPLYKALSERQLTNLGQLHRSGALGALEMGTVGKVLQMDPDAWTAQVSSNAQAADAKEEARHQELKAEEDALAGALRQLCRTARSAHIPRPDTFSWETVDVERAAIVSRCWDALGKAQHGSVELFMTGDGPAMQARRSLASAVFGDVAKLATLPIPPNTVSGSLLVGPRGTGKSLLIRALAELAVAQISQSAPFRVSVIYISGQSMEETSVAATLQQDKLWESLVGHALTELKAPHPDAVAHGAEGSGAQKCMPLSHWMYEMRRAQHTGPLRGDEWKDGRSHERIFFIVDEFDWWYHTKSGIRAAGQDLLNLLENCGDTAVYLTGSPAYASALAYEPHLVADIVPAAKSKLLGLEIAPAFNDQKLAPLQRLMRFSGEEALLFAQSQKRSALQPSLVAFIESYIHDFWASESPSTASATDHAGASPDSSQSTLASAKRAQLQFELGSVSPTPRSMLAPYDDRHASSPTSVADTADSAPARAWLDTQTNANRKSGRQFASRGTELSAILAAGLWAASGTGPLTVVELAKAALRKGGIKQGAKAIKAAEGLSQGDPELVRQAMSIATLAADEGILVSATDKSFACSSPSHLAGVTGAIWGLQDHGWSTYAVIAMFSNPAGAWGVLAESFLASVLDGGSVATFMTGATEQGFTGQHPCLAGMVLEKSIDGSFRPGLHAGTTPVVGNFPDEIQEFQIVPHIPGKNREFDERREELRMKQEQLAVGDMFKEYPDHYGGDITTIARLVFEKLRGTMHLRMQLKVNLKPMSTDHIRQHLTKMVVGVIRSIDPNTGRSRLLDAAIQDDDNCIVISNLLVLGGNMEEPEKMRDEFRTHSTTKKYIISFDSDVKSAVTEDGVEITTIPASFANGADVKGLNQAANDSRWDQIATSPVSFHYRGKEVHVTQGVCLLQEMPETAKFCQHQQGRQR
jgi:hypothetical protein